MTEKSLTRHCLLALGVSCFVGTFPALAEEVSDGPHLSRHEELIEAWRSTDTIDLKNPRAVFWHVFSRLPVEARIFPSENYYYWKLSINGRDIQGSIRLSAKERDEGYLGFAYSEARVETSEKDVGRLRVHERFGMDQGVTIRKEGAAIYDVGYSDHFVRFHLENLVQVLPDKKIIGSDEVMVGRTLDDSGVGFLLLFQTTEKYFFWVLDGSQPATEHFVTAGDSSMVGRRTGFVFWIDEKYGGRKILAAVKAGNVETNSYYDGPFDQLPDNHVETKKVNLQKWMEQENAELVGKIDAFGYYLEDDPPRRVALVRYASYRTLNELQALLKKATSASDPRKFFSRQGR